MSIGAALLAVKLAQREGAHLILPIFRRCEEYFQLIGIIFREQELGVPRKHDVIQFLHHQRLSRQKCGPLQISRKKHPCGRS